MQSNPHTCEPKDAPMSAAEYEAWLTMRDSQIIRVMEDGEDTTAGSSQDFYD